MSELARTLHEVAWYPQHDPRKASAEYRKTHDLLVVKIDTPCWICGIRNSTGGKMETHHSELEWAAEKAFEDDGQMLAGLVADLNGKITASTPADLREFLDSEGNMLILCATHHRGPYTGIHSITYPVWKLQRYEHADGFQFVRQTAAPASPTVAS